jgi:uncharacterized membrane protein
LGSWLVIFIFVVFVFVIVVVVVIIVHLFYTTQQARLTSQLHSLSHPEENEARRQRAKSEGGARV